jgi:hypothetical protein
MKHPVAKFAKAFQCCDKTILRAVLNQDHPSDWAPEPVETDAVSKAFGMKPYALELVMSGKDKLITVGQAAEKLGISVRRFHQRHETKKGYDPVVSHGRIVRYSENAIDLLADDL